MSSWLTRFNLADGSDGGYYTGKESWICEALADLPDPAGCDPGTLAYVLVDHSQWYVDDSHVWQAQPAPAAGDHPDLATHDTLGLATDAELSSGLAGKASTSHVHTGAPPIGSLVDWAGTIASVPANWLFCNGASLVRADYADLFSAIGTTWGAADGTHFNLPDTRDMYIVGARQDDTGVAKSNIRGSLEQSASATGATLTHNGSIADHPTLAHAGVAVGDHPSLSHAGFTPSAHATGGLTHAGFTASTHPTGSLSHAAAADHAAFTPSAHASGGLTHGGFTASSHPTGSLSHAALTHSNHAVATYSVQSGTASRITITPATATASHADHASFTHPALSHDGFASSAHAALSHDGFAALTHPASSAHPALAHDGVASSAHAALSHDGLASAAHGAASHAITQANNHGVVTHSFTAPSDHTASIVPSFLAMPKIIRYA